MKKKTITKLLAIVLAVLMMASPLTVFAVDGVEAVYELALFYKSTSTAIPSFAEDGESEYVESMIEGDELELYYQFIDCSQPDNSHIKWWSETPTLVDVTQEGVVKAFDSSKGAVVQEWIDQDVKSTPIIGSVAGKVMEKAFFNDYINLDSMDTEEICDIAIAAFGSDSILSDYVEAYQGELVDSLRYRLNNINSIIHCTLYSNSGEVLAEDTVRIVVLKNEEWYANFLPNGTHITNKSQISTVQAVGNTVQLYAITTPRRLNYGTVYSVESSSLFSQGKVVATCDDSGLVTFKNTGTVTIKVSPNSEDVVNGILKMVNYVYALENTGVLDTGDIADILIKYMGVDMNRTVLTGILDACFVVKDVVGGTTDPVQLSATAVALIANIVLQMKYNDTITFTVEEAEPITDFTIDGPTSVKEGTQVQLEIKDVQPVTGDKTDIVWSSSDPSIASIDENGVVTGRDAGGSLGSLSSQDVTITATSTTNNISRTYTMAVTGKTGRYISDATINGPKVVDIGESSTYTYSLYPERVSESENLSVQWGLVTGEDEEGNIEYTWASADAPAQTDNGTLTDRGVYTSLSGGTNDIALKAVSGYYLSNGEFYTISTKIVTLKVTNGVAVESIKLTCTGGTSNGKIDKDEIVTIDGVDYEYITIHKAALEAYAGNGANFSAAITPSDATNQTLKWYVTGGDGFKQEISEDTHSITLSLKTGSEGANTFNIYCTSEDGTVKSNDITLAITKNYVTSNVIDQDNYDVENGSDIDVSHTMTFNGTADGTYNALYNCNWYSSDTSIFTVRAKGNDNQDAIVTGEDVGVATLYCVSADGGIVATSTVTVYPNKEKLRKLVKLCESTVVLRTTENKSLYQKFQKRLDQAYYVLYDSSMASQTVVDTACDNLVSAFYNVGGFIGINEVDIVNSRGKKLTSDYNTVSVGSTSNYTGYSFQYKYDTNPVGSMVYKVTWTSSNSKVSVSNTGKCKPTSNDPCSAVITCTVEDFMGNTTSDSTYIAFARNAVTGVSLSETQLVDQPVGTQHTLTATITPNGLTDGASCKDVYWSSSNESIATVNENGVITYIAGGKCTITCTTADGGYTASCDVAVITNFENLSLLVQQYKDLALVEESYYPDTWATFQKAMKKAEDLIAANDSSQEEVDAMVTELESAYNGLSKYVYMTGCELYLDGEETSDFYQYDLSLLTDGLSYKNAKLNLKVRLYPNNSTYDKVSWTSSTSDISVNSEGVCTPTSNKACYGRITVTVEDHFGNKFSDYVWASYSYIPVTGMALSETNICGNIGETYQLLCTVEPTAKIGTIGRASIQDYYWASDDEEVATVDSNGLVTFTGAGSTKIKAISYDGGIEGVCTVSTEGDRSALISAIDQYKDIKPEDYAYAYGSQFKFALENAQDALTNVSLKQDEIDEATEQLIEAASALTGHELVKVTGVQFYYSAYKDPLVGSDTLVNSGTVSTTTENLTINLSSGYESNNKRNYLVLSPIVSPSNATSSKVEWITIASSNIEMSVSSNVPTIRATQSDAPAWATLQVRYEDDWGNAFVRTIDVVLTDNVATGFNIDQSTVDLIGVTNAQLTYSVLGGADVNAARFTSSNEDVVTVDNNGYLTAAGNGTAIVTGVSVDGGFTDTVVVTVATDFSKLAEKVNECQKLIEQSTDAYVYTQDSLDALTEETATAKAMVDSNRASQSEVNEEIQLLNDLKDALVPYVDATAITVSSKSGQSSVTNPKTGFVRFTGTTLSGKIVELQVTTEPAGSQYESIVWTSDNTDVTVNNKGVVTSSNGTSKVAKITATVTTHGGQTYSNYVYVSFTRFGVTKVVFDKDLVYGSPGESLKVTPTITAGANVSGTYVEDCIYSSADESIATVTNDGTITFVNGGQTTITCTTLDGGYQATIQAYTTNDTEALCAALDEGGNIAYTDYEYDYGMAFKNAFDHAVEVYEDYTSSQEAIDDATTQLTEAMNALSGHEYDAPEPVITISGNEVVDGSTYLVDASNNLTVEYEMNDTTYKSATWSYKNTSGVTASIVDDTVSVHQQTENNGSLTVSLKVVDDYDREVTYTYNIYTTNQYVNVQSFNFTADGEEITSASYSKSEVQSLTFAGVQFGYVPTPADATTPVSVAWSVSGNYLQIDENGLLTLTTKGKARVAANQSATGTVSCTLENPDGTEVSASINVTIS